jgi:hypothetical protein
MNIDTIINFLIETNDRLFPFSRTFKIFKNLHELSFYLKINLKPDINLHDLRNTLQVNIMFINENLEYITFGKNNYNKWICLIKHSNGYEILNIKQKYIINYSDICNLKINNLSEENILSDDINDDEYDDDEDYKAIDTNMTIDEENIIHTEELKSVKEIINKELYNDIQELLIDTMEMENNIIIPISNKIENKQDIIPIENIHNILNKMVKEKLINIIMLNDNSAKKSILNKNIKDKLIEIIIKNGYKY